MRASSSEAGPDTAGRTFAAVAVIGCMDAAAAPRSPGATIRRRTKTAMPPNATNPSTSREPSVPPIVGVELVVKDVHAFPGHIACDSASNSEVVVPIVRADGRLLGVLDLDSPVLNRFDEQDARGLERLVATFAAAIAADK